jgi:5-methylcytosine-specific restriction endonuclease McrA
VDNHKACTSCGQTQSLDAFSEDKSRKDALRSECRFCHNARNKIYRQANLKNYKAYNKAWQQANREKSAASKKAWYQANKEKSAANQKAYRKANPEKVKAYRKANFESIASRTKAYQQANPEIFAVNWQKRRVQKLNNGVFIVSAKELKKLYSNPCAYCGAPSQHIDHIIPVSRGGTHSVGNLVGACAACNMSKGAKFITEWKKSGLSGIL